MANAMDENNSVGRASVQWGGRPRPPTDMAAMDGLPNNTSHLSSFRSVHEEMIIDIKYIEALPSEEFPYRG
jgi:hypothetical protein